MAKIHGVLCDAAGDSDPDTTGTNEEIKDEYPLLWACKELAGLIGKAPWDRFRSNTGRQARRESKEGKRMSTDQNGAKAGTPSPERLGSQEHRAQLWDAINDYAIACGGTPGERTHGNTKRQAAVVEIENLVYGSSACTCKCSMGRRNDSK